jgi:hypothetical protein
MLIDVSGDFLMRAGEVSAIASAKMTKILAGIWSFSATKPTVESTLHP